MSEQQSQTRRELAAERDALAVELADAKTALEIAMTAHDLDKAAIKTAEASVVARDEQLATATAKITELAAGIAAATEAKEAAIAEATAAKELSAKAESKLAKVADACAKNPALVQAALEDAGDAPKHAATDAEANAQEKAADESEGEKAKAEDLTDDKTFLAAITGKGPIAVAKLYRKRESQKKERGKA